MGNDSKKTEWPRLESRVLGIGIDGQAPSCQKEKEKPKWKPAHKSPSFARWFCNAVVRLCDAVVERKRLRRGANAAEKRLRELRLRYYRKIDRGTASLHDRLEYLRAETAIYNAESNLEHALSNQCDIVRLMREQLVQAWQRHADRVAKRYAQSPDTERHRVMREISGLYAVLCLVDDFDIVHGSEKIGFVYDEVAKARRRFERQNDDTDATN